MKDADAADVLYGGTSSTTSPAASGFASRLTPEEQAPLDLLYDGGSAKSPETMLESAINRRRTEVTDAGISEAAFAQMRGDFIDTLKRTGLSEDFVVDLAEAHIRGVIGDTRSLDDADEGPGPSDAEVQAWNEQNLADLRVRYGGKEGEKLLERTRRWVRTQPALAKILQQHGVGSQPAIVKRLVAHVFSNGIV